MVILPQLSHQSLVCENKVLIKEEIAFKRTSSTLYSSPGFLIPELFLAYQSIECATIQTNTMK
jgi:hypothetical protein